MKNSTPFIIPLLGILLITGCREKEHTGNLNVRITNNFGNQVLSLNGEKYLSNGVDTVSFTGLKYMLSNVEMYEDGELKFEGNNSYYLIDENDTQSKSIEIDSIPVGEYDEIRISIGVDPLSNNGTAQGGNLGTGNGLFWIGWGRYVFFRVDGKYHNSTEYSLSNHIGGDNAYSIYSFKSLPKSIEIGKKKTTKMNVKIDLAGLYETSTPISLGDSSKRIVASDGLEMDVFGNNLSTGVISVTSIGTPE